MNRILGMTGPAAHLRDAVCRRVLSALATRALIVQFRSEPAGTNGTLVRQRRTKAPLRECQAASTAAGSRASTTTAAIPTIPSAFGCTGAAGAVGTRPSIHFWPGTWQTSWPMIGV